MGNERDAATDELRDGDCEFVSPLESFSPASESEQRALEGVLALLFETTEVDFSQYRQTTVLRRLSRRMSLAKVSTYVDYLALLERDPRGIEALYDDLLLSYTEFFRDPEVFHLLKERVFPALAEQHSSQSSIRIWVPGCSTGQEVYSMAIAYLEFAEQNKCNVKVQVFGTDLNARHIATARVATYPDKALVNVSPQRLEKCFDRTESGAKVRRHIRELCVFGVQNLVHDPPLANLDIVSCRNVLIYLEGPLQDVVLPLFHYSLGAGGYLLLGSAETAERFPGLFEAVDQGGHLFRRRPSHSQVPPAFLKASVAPRRGIAAERPHKPGLASKPPVSLDQHLNDLLVATYAPPCLLVDASFIVRHLRGRIFDILEPQSGEASLRLSKMVGQALMPELYVAIEEAHRSGKQVLRRDITLRHGSTTKKVKVSVTPTLTPGSSDPLYLVAFEDFEKQVATDGPEFSPDDSVDGEIQRLRCELEKTKSHLQTIIEEKDQANQDLWAANEEVQSTNEELQSINEEMEAAKEELESSNEELMTLNEELARKNAEISQAKEYADSLIDTAKAIVVTLDDQARITAFNRFAEELTGYARGEVLGKNWFELFIPVSERPDVSQVFADVLHQLSERAVHENIILLRNGSRRFIAWSNTVLRDAQGYICGALSVGMDITEQRQAGLALEASEEQYRTLVETSQDLIFECDAQGRYVYLNPAWEEVFGYRLDEMLGRKFIDFQTPQMAARDLARFVQLLSGGLVKGYETVHLDKHGREVHLVFSAKFVVSKTGEITGTRGTADDVSAQKAAERNYRNLFTSMLDGFALHEIITDGAGKPIDYRFLAVNPSFERITGLKAQDIIGRTAREVLPDLEQRWVDTYGEVVHSGQPCTFESHSADLSQHFAVTAFRPAPGQFACAFVDITERKSAEEIRLKLEQKEHQIQRLDSLGVLAGGIAHDFNNLLGGIYGFIDLASESTTEPQIQSYLERASTTITRAQGLTQQLLTFAKGGVPVRKVGHLAPFLRETVQFALSGAPVACRYDIAEDLKPCSFDQAQLAQVVENIVINAQQAMPLGGTLEVIARNLDLSELVHPSLQPGSYVKITVKDQGVGISPSLLDRVFEPFFTTKTKGHGLGLATCYSIVQRHGGVLEAESELGKGSSFHLILPAASEAEESEPKIAAPQHRGQGLFIIMDDEEIVRDMFRQMLESFGYEIRAAENGEEAISLTRGALAEGQSIAGMIFDLTVPGAMGGKQAIGPIRQLCPTTPVFVVSGYSNDPVMANPRDFGFTASLCKPFRKAEFSAMLAAHLPIKV